MKRLISILFALLLLPSFCSAVALTDIESNSKYYVKILEASEGTIYVDENSIKSIRYAPPYYTLQAKSYTVIYDMCTIAEEVYTINYDYNRSTIPLLQKVKKENPYKSKNELINILYREIIKDSGITYAATEVKFYKLSGELITKGPNLYNQKLSYNTNVFELANHIFKKAYNENFLPST